MWWLQQVTPRVRKKLHKFRNSWTNHWKYYAYEIVERTAKPGIGYTLTLVNKQIEKISRFKCLCYLITEQNSIHEERVGKSNTASFAVKIYSNLSLLAEPQK